MENVKNKVEKFFQAYEKRFATGLKGEPDVDGTVTAFANCFVEANPLGVICGQNDAKFREVVPNGYAFYRSIGTHSMKIISKDITSLDDFHFMCKIHWRSSFTKQNKEESIDFDVIYFLQHLKNNLKIFAYITGDEKKVLKEKGLV